MSTVKNYAKQVLDFADERLKNGRPTPDQLSAMTMTAVVNDLKQNLAAMKSSKTAWGDSVSPIEAQDLLTKARATIENLRRLSGRTITESDAKHGAQAVMALLEAELPQGSKGQPAGNFISRAWGGDSVGEFFANGLKPDLSEGDGLRIDASTQNERNFTEFSKLKTDFASLLK